ncbi:hypothetical protein SNEBB_003453 [Seison nebaliae]|nr:hypothetical protein SNEBB_003453 [Seison nebaliae]
MSEGEYVEDSVKTVVVVGGGISGSSAVRHLYENRNKLKLKIYLISASNYVQLVKEHRRIGRDLNEIFLENKTMEQMDNLSNSHVHYIRDEVTLIREGEILMREKGKIKFDKLILCCGAKPMELEQRLIDGNNSNEILKKIFTIRDQFSIDYLKTFLSNCNKITIVGDGGIASVCAYQLQKSIRTIDWIMKKDRICSPFVDSEIELMLLSDKFRRSKLKETEYIKRLKYEMDENDHRNISSICGAALGPDWGHFSENEKESLGKINYHKNSDIDSISVTNNQLSIKLKIGSIIQTDLIIVAIGVVANLNVVEKSFTENQLKLCQLHSLTNESKNREYGIEVDKYLNTSIPNIKAAGDVASLKMESYEDTWYQMRLWNVAMQMGEASAQNILHEFAPDNFPSLTYSPLVFTHVTELFGCRIVLLGRHKEEYFLPNTFELIIKQTTDEYIKLFVDKQRKIIRGAVLIGTDGIEEMIENLIFNQQSIEGLEDHLLTDEIDIDDFFD